LGIGAKTLNVEGQINHRDFLDRADMLGTLGRPVLITNYGEYRLAGYMFRYTRMPIGIVIGVHAEGTVRREVLRESRRRHSGILWPISSATS
jgi:hypothetical protein